MTQTIDLVNYFSKLRQNLLDLNSGWQKEAIPLTIEGCILYLENRHREAIQYENSVADCLQQIVSDKESLKSLKTYIFKMKKESV